MSAELKPIIEELQGESAGEITTELQDAVVRTYKVLSDRDRCLSYWGKIPTRKKVKELASSFLDSPPGYGIEAKAVFSYSEIKPLDPSSDLDYRRHHLCGQVFKREGKPFSADTSVGIRVDNIEQDFLYHRGMTGWEGEEIIRNASFWTEIQMVGDGATMLIDESEWPDEVKEICKDPISDKILPDVFWRSAAEYLMGVEATPTPFSGFFESLTGESYKEKSKKLQMFIRENFDVYQDPSELSKLVWDYINSGLFDLFSETFDGFAQDNAYKYPSGVYAILAVKGISQASGQQIRYRISDAEKDYLSIRGYAGFTVSGDIAITADNCICNDTTIVDAHDDLLRTLASKREKSVVNRISDLRRNAVGNTPNPLVEKKSQNIPANTMQILMYSDGLRLNYRHNRDLVSWRRMRIGLEQVDFTSPNLLTDPELTVLARRRQNRLAKARGDDGSFSYWGGWQELKHLAPPLDK